MNLDLFTYPNIAGKRHLRRYVAATLVIVIILGIVAIYTAAQRQETLALLESTPAPLAEILPPRTPSSSSVPPTATPLSISAEIMSTPCPTGPEQWTLADLSISDNFKRIYPACVYDGLAKAVAWAIANQSLGFTGVEAAQTLGLSAAPLVVDQDGTLVGMTDTLGPMPLAVTFPPTYPDFRSWLLTENLTPSITFTLRGCYRIYAVTGNQIDLWGEVYPVICIVSQDDEAVWKVSVLGGHRFTSGNPETQQLRSFALFGYQGEGNWVWIGMQKEPVIELEDIPDVQADRQLMSQLHGVTPWDAEWLETTYGIAMHPLFDNWQAFTDPSEIQAMLEAMNAYLAGNP